MLINRPVSHFGYVVPNIPAAAHHWSSLFGAGPFLLIEKMQFEQLSHYGEPCTFLHSAAFGQWGSVAIELMQIYEISPPSFAQMMIPSVVPVLNHVSYLSPEPEADSARLDTLGMPKFLQAKIGEVQVALHDATKTIGSVIEIHRQSPFIEGFFADIKAASQGWDGTQPLRPYQPK